MKLRNVALAAILTFALTVPAMAEESKLILTPASKTAAPAPKKPKQDADGDGRISMQEHLDWQKLYFQKVDANADGYLTKEEKSAYSAKKAAASAASAKEEPKKGFFSKIMGN